MLEAVPGCTKALARELGDRRGSSPLRPQARGEGPSIPRLGRGDDLATKGSNPKPSTAWSPRRLLRVSLHHPQSTSQMKASAGHAHRTHPQTTSSCLQDEKLGVGGAQGPRSSQGTGVGQGYQLNQGTGMSQGYRLNQGRGPGARRHTCNSTTALFPILLLVVTLLAGVSESKLIKHRAAVLAAPPGKLPEGPPGKLPAPPGKLPAPPGKLPGPAGPGGPPGPQGGGGGCTPTRAGRTAKFSVSGKYRVMTSNGCPGYASGGKGTAAPMPRQYEFKMPLNPQISTAPTSVRQPNSCVKGPIGVATSGIPIFSPCDPSGQDAVESSKGLLDSCGGLTTPMGDYMFPILPCTSNILAVYKKKYSGVKLCNNTFWREKKGRHSPLVAFMADGIPLFGPYAAKGRIPKNLDACNGHASDLKYYHYHGTSVYPYTVNCLRGCVDSSLWQNFGATTCTPLGVQYNYSALKSVKAT